METEHAYEVQVSWTTGRKGVLTSPVLNAPIEVAMPPQFPKGIKGIWSPEHLFVAAIASCFMNTFLSIAENSSLQFEHFNAKATGRLEIIQGRYAVTEVTLVPVVTLFPGQSETKARRILEKTEKNCLVSNSVKSKITLQPEIRTK